MATRGSCPSACAKELLFHQIGNDVPQKLVTLLDPRTVLGGYDDDDIAPFDHALDLGEVCFIGDDVNDVGALSTCGLAVAPAGAHRSAREKAGLVTEQPGGSGAVREVIDQLLDEAGSAQAE